MGTRSITTILEADADGKKRKVATIYCQYDGYPSGQGQKLHEFLHPINVCNGIGRNQTAGDWANGAGCLAAQLVKHLKAGIGNVYLVAPRTKLEWEDYGYEITVKADLSINVVVRRPGKKLFDGTVFEFGKFCSKES